jgi:hypothetical protein
MDELRLDGNAVGGLLGEIFPFEMTTAQVTCANCGSLWRVGQAMVYGDTTWVRSCAVLRATTLSSVSVEGQHDTC